MNRDLMKKLREEKPLTADEMLALEQALDKPSVSKLLRQVPDEAPSLAWRSELNQKLAAQSKPAKSRWTWIPAVAVPAMAAVALAVMIFPRGTSAPTAPSVAKDDGIEAEIVRLHLDQDRLATFPVQYSNGGSSIADPL